MNDTNVPLSDMKMRPESFWIVVVSSMEQIIGAGLSTLVGVMLPMIQLARHAYLSAALQGIIGAAGLVGIAFGSPIIGRLSDKHGYLKWFRICPLLIIAGALLCIFADSVACLIAGLFVIGFGVGGGYSLDSAYISELLPKKWRLVMVGIAKGTCAIGFIGVALYCWGVLSKWPQPKIWNDLMYLMVFMGVITFLMRIRWAESPKWLMSRGETQKAQAAVEKFYGKGVELTCTPAPSASPNNEVSWISMFKGENLRKTILCGVPWACEGLGVYGFGVFLPVLLIALGIESSHAAGIFKIINSVKVMALVNFFILPGFVIGLQIMRKVSHLKMLWAGFVISAVGLAVIYCGYVMHLPMWILILGFLLFEVALNAGPHLVTYILPSQVYPVDDRGTGNGIAAMTGKIGAILGVVIMPILLKAGGAPLVLIVSFGVMLLGAAITLIFGRGNIVNCDHKNK